jgi:hypothetical protein
MHEGVWSCKAHQQLVYKFDTRSIKGAAVDCQISGDGYRIEVSPDGQRWLGSYDSWSDAFTLKSLDLSFLTGSADELVKLYTIFPPGDASVLTEPGMSEVDGNHCRYLASKDSIVYQLDLRGAGECHVDLLAGNGYKLEGSSDGQTWKCLLAADQIDQKRTPDAAWLWSADATECLSSTGKLYLRFSDTGQAQRYGGRSAFLRRLTIYGNLKSEVVWIRFANTDPTRNFLMKQMVVRTWR